MVCIFVTEGDDAPRAVFPTRVGRPKYLALNRDVDVKDCFVGDEFSTYGRSSRGLRIAYPVDRGLINDDGWEDMNDVFHHTFYNELRISPEQHPVLVTEPTCNLERSRVKITKILFEKFESPAFYLASQEVLSLYTSGRVTGLSIHSGHGITTSVPVYEGFPISHACLRRTYSGADITENLVKILSERGYDMTRPVKREIVRDIKEKLCYIAPDFEKEMEKAESSAHCEHSYELPDGSKMTVGNERFRAPELLFNPSLVKSDEQSIHKTVVKSLGKEMMQDDDDLRNDLYNNIVLSGGSTMFEGDC